MVPVRHGKSGVSRDLAEAARHDAAARERVSVIQVHVGRLSQDRAEGLKARLGKVLGQVTGGGQATGSRCWPGSTRRSPISAMRRCRSTRRRSPRRSPSSNGCATTISPSSACASSAIRAAPQAARSTAATQPGLGILSDPDVLVLRRGNEAVTTTPEIRAFLHGPDPLIVTKANAKSVVHRRIYLDYIGVKTYDQKGALTGELRIVGLFTSTAYTRSVMKIPYLRSKAEAVIAKSGFNPSDHSGKALINVLESYPRDELFQIAVPTLRKHAEAILALGERPRVRALVRVDQFDRFVSVLVFVPRDRYDSHVRETIGGYPEDRLRGPACRPIIRPSRKAAWRASISSSAAPAARRRRSSRPRSRPASATSCGPGRTRCAEAAAEPAASTARSLAIASRFPGKLSRQLLGRPRRCATPAASPG